MSEKELRYESYNGKSFAVHGDRQKYSKILKTVGGRWNSRLKNQSPCWTVPKENEEALKKIIDDINGDVPEKSSPIPEIKSRKTQHKYHRAISVSEDSESDSSSAEDSEPTMSPEVKQVEDFIEKSKQENKKLFEEERQIMQKTEFEKALLKSKKNFRSEREYDLSSSSDSEENSSEEESSGHSSPIKVKPRRGSPVEEPRQESEKSRQSRKERPRRGSPVEEPRQESRHSRHSRKERRGSPVEEPRQESRHSRHSRKEREDRHGRHREDRRREDRHDHPREDRHREDRRDRHREDRRRPREDRHREDRHREREDRRRPRDDRYREREDRREHHRPREDRKQKTSRRARRSRRRENDSVSYYKSFAERPNRFRELYEPSDDDNDFSSSDISASSSDDFPMPETPRRNRREPDEHGKLFRKVRDMQQQLYKLERRKR